MSVQSKRRPSGPDSLPPLDKRFHYPEPPSKRSSKASLTRRASAPAGELRAPSSEEVTPPTTSQNSTENSPHSTTLELSYEDALAAFLRRYPAMKNDSQQAIDEMRKPGGDFERFDQQEQVYLDFTGGGQYGKSQLEKHMKQLSEGCFGNPHSVNPTSSHSTTLVSEARRSVLDFFNADPDEYMCIFTMNASGALRLVGESYPFNVGSHFALLQDTHNSVNGIREFARAKGATVTYTPVVSETLRMDVDQTSEVLDHLTSLCEASPKVPSGSRKLFAYPAQSNFSGVKHPLDMVSQAQADGWDVLLDAAAFVPTNRLDLRSVKPEFVCLSFYKMFGYPTGIGALLMKKSMIPHLHRPWFAGGTIEVVSVSASRYWPAKEHENFEDGTVSYLGIPSVKIGLDFMNKTLGGIDVINTRVTTFTRYLLSEMTNMVHSSGVHVVRVFGPGNTYNRGGTIAFDVYDKNDEFVCDLIVEKLAMVRNISIRAGCFCNPGASEAVFGSYLPKDTSTLPNELTKAMVRRMVSNVGAVRVSVGYTTNFADVYAFVQFIRSTFTDATVSDLEKLRDESGGSAPTCGATCPLK